MRQKSGCCLDRHPGTIASTSIQYPSGRKHQAALAAWNLIYFLKWVRSFLLDPKSPFEQCLWFCNPVFPFFKTCFSCPFWLGGNQTQAGERPARRGQRSDAAGRLVTAQDEQTLSVWAPSGQFEVQHVGAGCGWRLRAPGSVSTWVRCVRKGNPWLVPPEDTQVGVVTAENLPFRC